MDAELTTVIPGRPLPLPLRLLGDERLARLVGKGHEEAFSILYQRHHQALYRYCRSLVGAEADAQDALQSAMTSALVALRVSQRDAPIRPWLFRIAYNESMTQLRRRRPLSELVEELPALDCSPESAVEQKGRITRLLADLRELPERQRSALVMRELSGLSHQEVAEALGMSVGAAKQTVFEARRSLQEFDEGRSMACEDVRRLISDGDGRSLRGRRVRAHLRDCGGCATFAAAIPQRRADLHAIAPALPATAAAGLLWRITGAGSGQGGGGSAGLISGATSKAVVAGTSSKLVATGALIIVTAAVGTGGIIRAISSGGSGASSGAAVSRTAGPAAGSGSAATAHGSAKLGRHLTTNGRGAQAAGADHSSSAGSGRGKSGGHGQTKGGPSTAGLAHGHQGKGLGASGAVAGTQGKHLGAQSGSSHGSSGTSKPARPQPTKTDHPPASTGGAQNTTHQSGGSGTDSGGSGTSGTAKAGAGTTGSAQGVTSQANSAGNSAAGLAAQAATTAPSAG
jgi:RNA polymerase sigma factor (sigma-70 family)